MSLIALVEHQDAVTTWAPGLADRACCHRRIALLAIWDTFSRNLLPIPIRSSRPHVRVHARSRPRTARAGIWSTALRGCEIAASPGTTELPMPPTTKFTALY